MLLSQIQIEEFQEQVKDLQKTLAQVRNKDPHLQVLILHQLESLDLEIIALDLMINFFSIYFGIIPAHSKKDVLLNASMRRMARRPIIANLPLILSA